MSAPKSAAVCDATGGTAGETALLQEGWQSDARHARSDPPAKAAQVAARIAGDAMNTEAARPVTEEVQAILHAVHPPDSATRAGWCCR